MVCRGSGGGGDGKGQEDKKKWRAGDGRGAKWKTNKTNKQARNKRAHQHKQNSHIINQSFNQSVSHVHKQNLAVTQSLDLQSSNCLGPGVAGTTALTRPETKQSRTGDRNKRSAITAPKPPKPTTLNRRQTKAIPGVDLRASHSGRQVKTTALPAHPQRETSALSLMLASPPTVKYWKNTLSRVVGLGLWGGMRGCWKLKASPKLCVS